MTRALVDNWPERSTDRHNAVIQCNDTTIASEMCEKIWMPKNMHVEYGLDGVEIITNGSGSYHELRKLTDRHNLIKNASKRNGGVYIYSNLKGCDGRRIYLTGVLNRYASKPITAIGRQTKFSSQIKS